MANPYVIGDLPGFTPQIARLVGMMSYVRQTTVEAVHGLTQAQLDVVIDEKANSAGALLMHIAAVENEYQAITLGTHVALPDFEAALDLGERARNEIRGHDLPHYLDILEVVRKRTLAEFAKRDDAWLMEESNFFRGQPTNNYFKWFHVFEDELNHRGQIRFIVKRLR